MRELLERADRAAAWVEILVAASALLVVLVVALGTVLARTLAVGTSEWVLELPMELLVVIAVFGSGFLIREERHLSVDLLVSRLPARWKRHVVTGSRALLLLLCAFLSERAVRAALQARGAGLVLPELFDLPRSAPLSLAALGFALWGFHFLAQLTRRNGSG